MVPRRDFSETSSHLLSTDPDPVILCTKRTHTSSRRSTRHNRRSEISFTKHRHVRLSQGKPGRRRAGKRRERVLRLCETELRSRSASSSTCSTTANCGERKCSKRRSRKGLCERRCRRSRHRCHHRRRWYRCSRRRHRRSHGRSSRAKESQQSRRATEPASSAAGATTGSRAAGRFTRQLQARLLCLPRRAPLLRSVITHPRLTSSAAAES